MTVENNSTIPALFFFLITPAVVKYPTNHMYIFSPKTYIYIYIYIKEAQNEQNLQ
jgi:hypothetical protein